MPNADGTSNADAYVPVYGSPVTNSTLDVAAGDGGFAASLAAAVNYDGVARVRLWP